MMKLFLILTLTLFIITSCQKEIFYDDFVIINHSIHLDISQSENYKYQFECTRYSDINLQEKRLNECILLTNLKYRIGDRVIISDYMEHQKIINYGR